MNEQAPLPHRVAALAEVRCIASTVSLLARRRIHLPRTHVRMRLRFADQTTAPVYRETVVDGVSVEPCVLLVEFKLRAVRGWGHTLFRWESLLNTPLFVGFPGFASKLWLTDDEHGLYRGCYEWDGADRAAGYVQALSWVLGLVSVPGSIRAHVVPGVHRDDALARPEVLGPPVEDTEEWWRPIAPAGRR